MPFDSPLYVASVAALLVGCLAIASGLGIAIGDTAARTDTQDRVFLRSIALVPIGMVFLLIALAGAFLLNS